MSVLPLEDARSIAKTLRELSSSLGRYRFDSWNELSNEERLRIEGLEWTLLNYSSDMTATAIEIATDDIQAHVFYLKSAIDKLDGILTKIDDVRKVIGIATKTVTLAASIATGNIQAINDAVDGLLQEVA